MNQKHDQASWEAETYSSCSRRSRLFFLMILICGCDTRLRWWMCAEEEYDDNVDDDSSNNGIYDNNSRVKLVIIWRHKHTNNKQSENVRLIHQFDELAIDGTASGAVHVRLSRHEKVVGIYKPSSFAWCATLRRAIGQAIAEGRAVESIGRTWQGRQLSQGDGSRQGWRMHRVCISLVSHTVSCLRWRLPAPRPLWRPSPVNSDRDDDTSDSECVFIAWRVGVVAEKESFSNPTFKHQRLVPTLRRLYRCRLCRRGYSCGFPIRLRLGGRGPTDGGSHGNSSCEQICRLEDW